MAKNYTKQEIKQAIEGSGGIVSAIAKKLGCEWHTAEKYVNKYRETKEALSGEFERTLDLAESKLIANIKEGRETSLIFFLKTRGKKRGYIETLQTEEIGKPFGELMKKLAERKNGSSKGDH